MSALKTKTKEPSLRPPSGPALLEAAGALLRLGLAQVQGMQDMSPTCAHRSSETTADGQDATRGGPQGPCACGAREGQRCLATLEGVDLAAEVAAACAHALQTLRPPQAELTLRLYPSPRAPELSLRGSDVNPQCATERGGSHTLTLAVNPPDSLVPIWSVLEAAHFKIGDLQVELQRPPRPAWPEEIARHKARLDDLAAEASRLQAVAGEIEDRAAEVSRLQPAEGQ